MLPKRRQAGQFLGNGNLQVVPGNALMVCRRFNVERRTLVEISGIHHYMSLTRSVRRALHVMG